MGSRIRIAQLNLLVGDIAGNAERVVESAVCARAQGVDLLVFPELTLTGYPPEDLLLRPELMDRVERALQRVQSATMGITLVLGYPRASMGGLYNVAGVLRDGELLGEYAKQQLPNYSVFDEKRYFQPGNSALVFEHRGLRMGVSICEDIWQEDPSRQAAAAGAQVLINLNASPFDMGKRAQREAVVSLRAAEHGLLILYANLVGGQDELVFDGASFVVDPKGVIVRRAGEFEEALLTLDLDDAGQPLICDEPSPEGPSGVPGARPHAPLSEGGDPEDAEIASVYRALVLGVRDYVRKNGFSGAILGLSGGVDSALTLAIAVDALGAEAVAGLLMPSRYTSEMSNADALEQARRLGVETRIVSIEPAFQALVGMLQPAFMGLPTVTGVGDVTEENIQARCRGTILMAVSNKTGRILLTTGNKSEMSVGYATLYGDMAGGFAPIKDVPKLMVYRLARYRNRIAPVIPDRVLTRPPSAELRPDQTDQDSLPPYELLDAILYRYIECDESVEAIVAHGYPHEVVRRVARLVDRNEYKRRQAPPGVRISTRAFGRDRRYPITSGF